jgi:hypothetical protein
VHKLALGQVSLRVLTVFPGIIPPMLHANLHLKCSILIRRTSRRSLGYFKQSNDGVDNALRWKEQYLQSVRPCTGSQSGSNYDVHSTMNNNYCLLHSKTGIAVKGRCHIRILAHKSTTLTDLFTVSPQFL